jgi:predicted membrane channel-forming protein YqfA (hemolysin III family)
MRAEAQHLDDDGESFRWAFGCVYACCSERVRAFPIRELLSLHSLAVLWIITFIVSSAFNVSIVVATRLRYQYMANAMGSFMEGFHYNRFIPLADAMPIGLFVLMTFVVVLFAASLWLSLQRRPAAFWTFCGAVGLSVGTWLYELRIPAYVQAMAPQHLGRNGICFALTTLVLGAARFIGQATAPTTPRLNRSRP